MLGQAHLVATRFCEGNVGNTVLEWGGCQHVTILTAFCLKASRMTHPQQLRPNQRYDFISNAFHAEAVTCLHIEPQQGLGVGCPDVKPPKISTIGAGNGEPVQVINLCPVSEMPLNTAHNSLLVGDHRIYLTAFDISGILRSQL
jgi:hypothetical protein